MRNSVSRIHREELRPQARRALLPRRRATAGRSDDSSGPARTARRLLAVGTRTVCLARAGLTDTRSPASFLSASIASRAATPPLACTLAVPFSSIADPRRLDVSMDITMIAPRVSGGEPREPGSVCGFSAARCACAARRGAPALRTLGSTERRQRPLTLIWFVVWLVFNLVGDKEPLTFDPVNWWAGSAAPGDRPRPEPTARAPARQDVGGD